MAQRFAGTCSMPSRVANAFVFAGILLAAPVVFSSAASSQALGYASPMQSAFLSGNAVMGRGEPAYEADSRVDVGTKVVVLPKSSLPLAAGATEPRAIELKATIAGTPGAARSRAIAVSIRGQAINVSTSSLY